MSRDIGVWSVEETANGSVYFLYRENTMGRFSGSRETAEYMVTCINAGLSAYAPIAAAVQAEAWWVDE